MMKSSICVRTAARPVCLRLLHEVVRLNQALAGKRRLRTGDVTLNQALEAALRRAKHDHLVVLISDLDGADDETQRLATLLAAHNDVLDRRHLRSAGGLACRAAPA